MARYKTLLMGAALFAACGAGCMPNTFIRGESGRKVIELRDGIDPERAWQETVDIIASGWDIEQLSKEGGFLRTAWHHGISGANQRRYRGRITVKFRPAAERQLELMTEAQWLDRMTGQWTEGYDTLLQRDVYGAIAGRIGRIITN